MRALPAATWRMHSAEKKIYLTFDDGPIPELTPWVLDQLDAYRAKATFFYVGENVVKHPALARRAIESGHSIGNHTHNHVKGWSIRQSDYLDNVEKCREAIASNTGVSTRLFRPPYGQITFSLTKKLSANYRVVMWDYLTGDFDPKLRPEICHSGALKGTSPGSIVIYHENVKAEPRIRYSLPRFLEHFSHQGYQFCAID